MAQLCEYRPALQNPEIRYPDVDTKKGQNLDLVSIIKQLKSHIFHCQLFTLLLSLIHIVSNPQKIGSSTPSCLRTKQPDITMSSSSPNGQSQSKSRSRGGRRSRRNRSQVPAAPQPDIKEEEYDSEDGYEAPPPRRRRQQTQQIQQQQSQQGGGPLGGLPLVGGGGVGDALPVGNVGETVNNLANSAQGTLGNVTGGALGGAVGGGGGDSGKSDTLKLRLDLNLEVEVTLKARIHGDLTLALL
ncbi:hypothetical protein F5B21DRAFT_491738 [Xylaria acuta]|nr:hypothetical protein F5B21DRAFT_491738 [Xylaria acuta]